MSRKIIDLTPRTSQTLDVTGFFPMSRVSPSRKGSHIFTDIVTDFRERISLFIPGEIHVDQFETLRMLDLANPELFIEPPTVWWKFWKKENSRKKRIDLFPKLNIPFGGLDIRRTEGKTVLSSGEEEAKETVLFPFSRIHTYPDLFVRTLPWDRKILRFFRIRKKLWKGMAYTFGIIFISALLFGIPFFEYMKYSFQDAEYRLIHILSATGNTSIRDDALRARTTFERANIFLSPFFLLLDNPIIHIDQVSSARALIDAGLATTRGIDAIARTLPTGSFVFATGTTNVDPLAPNYRAPAEDIYPLSRYGIENPTEWYETNRSAIYTFLDEMENASRALENFTTIGNGEKDAQIHDLGLTLHRFVTYGQFFRDHEKDMLKMLGSDAPMRYIVFNQNRDELRANGGFPGTIFTFTLFQGNILEYRKDDVYYYDWNLFPNAEVPPAGLENFETFGLRDVTYYPIFRESLDKANTFIEKSGESSVTTGIAINQGMIEEILSVVGPVSVSGVVDPFTSENFSTLMSTLVEAKYAKEKTPKDILFTFVETLEKKVLQSGKIDDVLAILEANLKNGEILIRSRDEETDNFLRSFNIFDTFVADTGNWVYPIFTNIGGNKSDRFMTRSFTRTAEKISGCDIENTLTITSTHSFTGADEARILSYMDHLGITDEAMREQLLTIEGDGVNKAFVRIVAPFGSTLMNDSTSIQVDNSRLDYTVFSFEIDTPVGTTSERTIEYISHPTDCEEEGKIYAQPGLRVE